ncbi:MAG: cation:dicarboxylase symporter family transporter [Clostridiaceae bacterium]|nr:cation:dicarboxylase symporter family transporter [Clostridiaceae bacterium]
MGESSFLSSYIKISDLRTVAFLLILIGTFFIIRLFEKKKIKFTTRTIYATLIGLVLGIIIQAIASFPENPGEITWLSEVSTWYGFVGSGFMDLLKMLVVPMVFVSILKVIINMGEGDNFQSLTLKSIGILMGTTTIAAIVGVIVANIMNLGKNLSTGTLDSEIREIVPLADTLRGMLPSNPIDAMASGNVVAVIIFAAFLGIATRRMNKKYPDIIKPFIDLVEAFYKVIVSVAMTVIKFMPYAVVAMLANTLVSRGISSMISVIYFIVGLYIAVIIVFLIHLIILALNGLNPLKYLKNVSEALLLAFTSRSSLGTLPVTIETLKDKQGVEEGVASFVASLGANMGMNGCAGIYPAMMTVTLANMAGIEMNIGFYVMMLIVIAISSLGIAGLPGTATMAVSVVLSGVGLGGYFPLASGIIAIDPILDMGRTMLNVNGTNVTAVIVAKSNKKLDKEKFNE